MVQRSQRIQHKARYHRLTGQFQQSFVVSLVMLLLVACGITTSPDGGLAPPSSTSAALPATQPEPPSTTDVEYQSVAIEHAMNNGSFAGSYGGLYFENGRYIVLVTEDPQPVQEFLTARGIPPAAFEVRRVNTTLARLQQAEIATRHGLEHFPGNWGVAIDQRSNKVLISIERQPLIEFLGYDPGDKAVPYEQWPLALKEALAEIVPEVDVELHAGFSMTEQSKVP